MDHDAAVGVDASDVAGAKECFGVEGGGRCAGVVEVARKDLRAFGKDLLWLLAVLEHSVQVFGVEGTLLLQSLSNRNWKQTHLSLFTNTK